MSLTAWDHTRLLHKNVARRDLLTPAEPRCEGATGMAWAVAAACAPNQSAAGVRSAAALATLSAGSAEGLQKEDLLSWGSWDDSGQLAAIALTRGICRCR